MTMSHDNAPRASIIVNSFNPGNSGRIRAMTELAIRCYKDYTRIPHELILVDGADGEDQALRTICDQLGYRYLHLGRRLTFAQGYNAGLRASIAPWRVIAASDIFVVSGWLEALLSAAERTGAWMVSPYLSQSDYPAQRRGFVFAHRTFVPDFLTFNLNLISSRCFETVGLVDEQFSGCFNDIDYALRIREKGGEIALAYCGDITHLGRGTLGLEGVAAMVTRDRPLFEAKWPDIWDDNTLYLRTRGGLKGLLLRTISILPNSAKRQALTLIRRLEPLL